VVLTGLAGVLRLAAALGRAATPRLDRRALLRLAASAVLALGLSAAQWMPTVDLVRRSSRSTMPSGSNLYWSVHPYALGELILPRALPSLPLSEAARATLFESREPFLPSLYLGLIPLVLLVPLAGQADRSRARLAGGGALFFLVASLGRHSILLPLLLRAPGLSWFRYPVKYTVGLALFAALLAGLGLDAWRATPSEGQRRGTWALAAAAIALAAVFLASGQWVRVHARELGRWVDAPPDWRPSAYAPVVALLGRASALTAAAALAWAWRARSARPLPVAVLAVLATADLATAARGVNDLGPPELAAARPPALALLGEPFEARRLYTPSLPPASLNRALVRGPAGWDPAWSWALGLQETLAPPTGARWGLRGSYEADLTGLAPPRAQLLAAFVVRYQDQAIGKRVLRMGGVTDIVTQRRMATPGLVPAGEAPTVFSEPVRVWRVPAPAPRAFVVGTAVAAPGDEAMRALGDPAFDPRATVLVDDRPTAAPAGFQGEARIVESRADRWRVETEATHAGFLVVLDAFDPGWRATVDGREAAVRRANVVFRAVEVPAGRHLVEMRHRPFAAFAGLAVSASAIAAIVVVTGGAARRGPRVEAGTGAELRSPAPEARPA
jgi:hypothetical protein